MSAFRLLPACLAVLLLAGCGDAADKDPGPAPAPDAAPQAPPDGASEAAPEAPAPEADASAPAGRLVAALGEVKKTEARSFGPMSAGGASTGYGQVTLQNNTSFTLDLYVGDAYGCRALRNLMCTTQVRAGTHTLTAKAPHGASVSVQATLESGDSVTWTVSEE